MDEFDFKKKFGVEPYLPFRDGLLYKYFNLERGLDSILSESLYFASPKQLNDSFEMDVRKIVFKMTDANINSLLHRYFPNDQIERERIFELSKTNRALDPDLMMKGLTQIRNQSGICCFTTDPRSRLMWGHYGNSDSGICIGFNLPPVFPYIKDMFIMKVVYESERSFINYFDRPFSIFPIWAFVKNSSWDYEKEIRAVHMSYNGLLKYNLNSIEEIHYGMKISENNLGRVESLLSLKNHTNYRRLKIESSDSSYDLLSTPF